MAQAPCRWCRAPIGYYDEADWNGRSGEFYVIADEFAHAVCEEEATDEQRSGGTPEPVRE
jgi:hypothetical protein